MTIMYTAGYDVWYPTAFNAYQNDAMAIGSGQGDASSSPGEIRCTY